MSNLIRSSHFIGFVLGSLFLLFAYGVDAREAKTKVTITVLSKGSESFRSCIVRLTKKLRPKSGFQAAQITAICRKQISEKAFIREIL